MPTARTATISVATYAWNKLAMNGISGLYVSFMHGPYLEQPKRDRKLYCLWVACSDGL